MDGKDWALLLKGCTESAAAQHAAGSRHPANPSVQLFVGFCRVHFTADSTFIWRGSCRTPLLTPWGAALAMVVLPTSFVRTSRHLVLLITASLAGEVAVANKGMPGMAAAGGTIGVPPAPPAAL